MSLTYLYRIELPNAGSKVLAVQDATFTNLVHGPGYAVSYKQHGTLDIHGRPRMAVWTKVAESVFARSTTLVTVDEVDFEPGDMIIITSSSSSMYETEELTVVSTSSDGHTVLFTPPLQHDHMAKIYTYDGEDIDMRVEVALISRNIVIQGDDSSEAQQFGAHTIAVGGGKRLCSD